MTSKTLPLLFIVSFVHPATIDAKTGLPSGTSIEVYFKYASELEKQLKATYGEDTLVVGTHHYQLDNQEETLKINCVNPNLFPNEAQAAEMLEQLEKLKAEAVETIANLKKQVPKNDA